MCHGVRFPRLHHIRGRSANGNTLRWHCKIRGSIPLVSTKISCRPVAWSALLDKQYGFESQAGRKKHEVDTGRVYG